MVRHAERRKAYRGTLKIIATPDAVDRTQKQPQKPEQQDYQTGTIVKLGGNAMDTDGAG